MNPREKAKWAAIGGAIGILIGLLIGGRYDVRPVGDGTFGWRIDRWTGHAEMIVPDVQSLRTQGR
jgi:hypothetical protein